MNVTSVVIRLAVCLFLVFLAIPGNAQSQPGGSSSVVAVQTTDSVAAVEPAANHVPKALDEFEAIVAKYEALKKNNGDPGAFNVHMDQLTVDVQAWVAKWNKVSSASPPGEVAQLQGRLNAINQRLMALYQ